MRFAGSLAFAVLLGASNAMATVTEPNGLVVPLDSNNGEVQLPAFFQQSGEPIDWKQDAAATPTSFSPLCGFSAKFVLHQAGSNLGLAWYNDDGQQPVLHNVVPPGSPVGTLVTSANIKLDPGYKGGKVGFALVGNQTHYTDPKWGPQCSLGCNPNGPWITALIYASKTIPQAYYVAFEDGNIGSSFVQFNNDGDFNDYVFLLTGLTCSGGGATCDTGKPGACGPGVMACVSGGLSCQSVFSPGAESCNGIDDDCNGSTDEGDLCPDNNICDKGKCVARCNGEFSCPQDKVCSSYGYCVDPSCKDVNCPSGQLCVAGVCKAPCDGVVCPHGQVCSPGGCVDPCAAVKCGMDEVCLSGVCVQNCACAPCVGGKSCDMASGQCVDAACVGKPACGAGQHCEAGACVDDCSGAVCPSGEQCQLGACVGIPSMSGAGGANGAGGSSFLGAGGSDGAASGQGGGAVDDPGVKAASGCGCAIEESSGGSAARYGAFAALAVGVALRRRRRGATGRPA